MFKINHVWHIDCDKFQNIYLFVYIFHLSKFTWVKRKPNPKQTAKNKESNYIVSTNDKKIPCPLSWFLLNKTTCLAPRRPNVILIF